MQDLKVKLEDQGLVGTLVIRETGQKIPLRFGRGEYSKACKLELGPVSQEVELRLVEVPGAKQEQANLTLVIVGKGAPTIDAADDAATQAAAVEAAAKAEADAAAKAVDEAAAVEAAAAKERAEATRLTEEAAAKAVADEAAAAQGADAPSNIPVEEPMSTSVSVAPEKKSSRGDKKGT